MFLRRFAAPALLGLTAAACSGERVAAPTPNQLTSLQRAAIAERLVNAAGTSAAAPGANLAAAVIMSGAQPSRVTATRDGFPAVARVGDAPIAANVVSATAEGVTYNVIGFHMIDRTFSDTVMGIVAWNVTGDNTPSSFVVTYAFGEGNGDFDNSGGAATAFGYVFDGPTATWVATSGTAGMVRKSVGGACDTFVYRDAQASCRLASFSAAVNITGTEPAAADGNSATGSLTFSLPTGYLNGVSVEITPTQVATLVAARRR